MSQDVFMMLVEVALTVGIGIISYLLKRTITELDKCKADIAEARENGVKRHELNECKKDITQVKADYITREDFFREQGDTRRKLDNIMGILLEIKGVSNK